MSVYRKEQAVERYLTDRVKSINGWAFKFTSPGMSGVPDRIILRRGRVVFVELKAPGAELTKQQRIVHRCFAGLGFTVEVIRTRSEADDLIRRLERGADEVSPARLSESSSEVDI